MVTPVMVTVTAVELPTVTGVVMVTALDPPPDTDCAACVETTYELAVEGNMVPTGAVRVIVLALAASAPVELVLNPIVYVAAAPAVAGVGEGPVTVVTVVPIPYGAVVTTPTSELVDMPIVYEPADGFVTPVMVTDTAVESATATGTVMQTVAPGVPAHAAPVTVVAAVLLTT